MGLTLIAAVAGVVVLILGIGAISAGTSQYGSFATKVAIGFGILMVAIGVGGVIISIWSYNNNQRIAKQSCIDNHGVIYLNQCVDKAPVVIQPLY